MGVGPDLHHPGHAQPLPAHCPKPQGLRENPSCASPWLCLGSRGNPIPHWRNWGAEREKSLIFSPLAGPLFCPPLLTLPPGHHLGPPLPCPYQPRPHCGSQKQWQPQRPGQGPSFLLPAICMESWHLCLLGGPLIPMDPGCLDLWVPEGRGAQNLGFSRGWRSTLLSL